MRSERLRGWLGPIGVALFAFVVRVWNVDYPKNLLFDETYYAKDAYSLLKFGYVQDYIEKANEKIVAGDLTGLWTGEPTQIAHPDGGKWLIALGEALFGMNSFGWRISAVVAGALTVLVLARLVRRLTGSTWIGCFAGGLLALDGMHFVLSRTALLDIFLAFWLVCAVACLVADRDWMMARIDRYRFVRPWQVLAGVCFGLALGTKWNAIYVLAAFGLLIVAWEVFARRGLPEPPRWVTSLFAVGLPAFVTLVGIALLVYLATWTGWLLHHDVYEQRFGHGYGDNPAWGDYVNQPRGGVAGFFDALRSLWHYHVMTYDFHTGEYLAGKTHPYQSNPWGWLILERPVGVDAQNGLAASLCGTAQDSTCMREILILGNPAVWWAGALAIAASCVAWIKTRSWQWSIPVVGVAATWLPWFAHTDRPIFSYYAVVILPFMIVALSLVADGAWRAAQSFRQRYAVWLGFGLLFTAAAILFWYFHPIYTDDLISYDAWLNRMWFRRWI